MACRAICWLLTSLWIAVVLCAINCVMVDAVDGVVDAGPTPVHAADEMDTTWTPVTATPVQPPCSPTTQEKLTKFSLFNIELERRCQAQSGGGNAFPFDVAPSREQLVRLSASPACLVVCTGVLRLVEHECILGDFRMPIRATAETVLKLSQDIKDLARNPIPPEDVLHQQIVQRARINTARDIDPIGFSMAKYPEEMLQYQPQLTKAYAAGGIVMLSSEYKIISDLSTTESQSQVDSANLAAAVAEISRPVDTLPPPSESGVGVYAHVDDASAEKENDILTPSPSSSSGSYSTFRAEPIRHGSASASGSLTDAAVVKPQATSASTRTLVTFPAISVLSAILLVIA